MESYRDWVELLLDRQKLKQDRVAPVFMAYGLVEGLAGLIKKTADNSAKEALSNLSQELDEKEKDAYESGLRRVSAQPCSRRFRTIRVLSLQQIMIILQV